VSAIKKVHSVRDNPIEEIQVPKGYKGKSEFRDEEPKDSLRREAETREREVKKSSYDVKTRARVIKRKIRREDELSREAG